MKTSTILLSALVGAAALAAPGVRAAAPVQPSEVVYLPQLPSAASLSQQAAAEGQTIDQINQSNGQMTVVYHTANGGTNAIQYQVLPTAVGVSPTSAPPPVDVAAPGVAAAPNTATVATNPPAYDPNATVYDAQPGDVGYATSDYPLYAYDTYPYAYGYYGPYWGGLGIGLGLWGGWGGYYGGFYGHPGYYGYRGGYAHPGIAHPGFAHPAFRGGFRGGSRGGGGHGFRR